MGELAPEREVISGTVRDGLKFAAEGGRMIVSGRITKLLRLEIDANDGLGSTIRRVRWLV